MKVNSIIFCAVHSPQQSPMCYAIPDNPERSLFVIFIISNHMWYHPIYISPCILLMHSVISEWVILWNAWAGCTDLSNLNCPTGHCLMTNIVNRAPSSLPEQISSILEDHLFGHIISYICSPVHIIYLIHIWSYGLYIMLSLSECAGPDNIQFGILPALHLTF